MSSLPDLPAPKPQLPPSRSDGHYPREETYTETIQTSCSDNSGSYHSSSDCSECTTYSASAIGAESIIYATTSDTLGMIETPWTTESWQSHITHVSNVTPYSSTPSESTSTESALTLTAFTIDPKSSVSTGVRSPSLLTLSNDTWKWTCLNSVSTFNITSLTPAGKTHNVDSQDTISSWTLQSYTSTGIVDEESKLRVNYPWSPRTVRSDSTGITAYPSSISVEPQSTFTTATTPAATSQTDFKRLIPINYLVLDTTRRIFKHP
ncbi:uncharacterized protein [Choristoneura fumiferana]|uniref:uncharacterized protein n=1 Tax=Choristoneura fumiferana TaxID=7141 RepID=UPI003D1541D9